jgi:hypothetical protein
MSLSQKFDVERREFVDLLAAMLDGKRNFVSDANGLDAVVILIAYVADVEKYPADLRRGVIG